MPPTTIKVDTSEFSRAMREYLPVSRMSFAEAINKKGFHIARAAVAITKRANKAEIRAALREEIVVITNHLSGLKTGRMAPRFAVLANIRHKELYGRGLYGDEMRAYVEKMISHRVNAVNFLRAGWLSAVYVFAKAIGVTPGANSANFFARFGFFKDGRPTGEGVSASKATWFPKASLSNMAFSRDTSTKNGIKFAEAGLRQALAQEVASMAGFIAREQQKAAARFVGRLLS